MQDHFDKERELQQRIESMLAAAEPDVDVRDVELDGAREQVRLFIAHPDGVSLELCSRVTTLVHDLVPEFGLEVSSPGVEPPLRRPEHFRAALGEEVRFRRRGAKRPFVATVTEVGESTVSVQRAEGVGEEIPFREIVRSHLVEQPAPAPVRPGRQRKGARQ